MLINRMTFALFSQCIFVHGAADEAIAKLTLLGCYDRKPVAMPGTGMHCAWTAHHTVLAVAKMSDCDRSKLAASLFEGTARILCCYIGSVEGENEELIDKTMEAVARKLHPGNLAWIQPFDDVIELDLKELSLDATPVEQLSCLRSLFIRFRCTNDCPLLYRQDARGGIFRSSIIVPSSFNEHALAVLKQESALFNDDERRRLRSLARKQEIAPDVIDLLDVYARKQDDFHEATYLVLNPAKFAAFVAQEFGH